MFEFNTVEEALEDLRQGRLILVTDDGYENLNSLSKELEVIG